MGFGLPSAIGAWFANKNEEVWTVVGDGGFQMTQAELSTAAQEGANVKIAIMNNNFLGMVRQWQEFFFEKRYSAVNEVANVKIALMNNNFLGMVRQWQEFFFEKRYSAVQMRNPDFVKIAEAHGVTARRVFKPEDVAEAIAFARATPGPVLLEFRVEQEEAVYPMVPAGADLDNMIRRPVRKKLEDGQAVAQPGSSD